MLNASQLAEILSCRACKQRIVAPVVLPCSSTVCKKHVDQLERAEDGTISCAMCGGRHTLPAQGFPTNTVTELLIQADASKQQLDQLHLWNQTKLACIRLHEKIAEFEEIIAHPCDFITNYAASIIEKVQLKRDAEKTETDKYYTRLISELEQFRNECIESVTKLDIPLNILNPAIKKSLDRNIELLESNSFADDRQRLEEIQHDVDLNEVKVQLILDNLKDLLLCEKTCAFYENVAIEVSPRRFFGAVAIKSGSQVLDSIILDEGGTGDLMKLCNFSHGGHWKMIYRGSVHGFGSKDFHDRCDGIARTLSIIKTTKGFIFGGYTSRAWDSTNSFRGDENAFIFSLVNKYHEPLKCMCMVTKYAIYCHQHFGPSFATAIVIADNSDKNNLSCSNPVYSYKVESLTSVPIQAREFLAGDFKFQVNDIEVFQRLEPSIERIKGSFSSESDEMAKLQERLHS